MKTNEQLIIEYAQNRIELQDTRRLIRSVYDATHGTLSRHLSNHFDEDNPDYRWDGFVHFLKYFCDSTERTADVYRLAELKDRIRDINRQAGQIKRDICARGRQLLRANNQ